MSQRQRISIVRVGRRPRSVASKVDFIRMGVCFLFAPALLVWYWGTWWILLGALVLVFGLWFLFRDILGYRIKRTSERPGESTRKAT